MSKPTVQVILENRLAHLIRPYPYQQFAEVLRYHPHGYYFTPAYRNGGWDGWICLLRYDRMGAGLFLSFREELERAGGVQFQVDDRRRAPEFGEERKGPGEEREYQKQCVEKMLEASKIGGLVLNSTGTGKTHIAGRYFQRLKGSACFVVDELTLMKQAQKELAKVLGEKVGVIGNQEFRPERITVATIQTLHRHCRDKKFQPWANSLQVMMLDELHLMLNRRNFVTVAAIKPPVVFGLTATLELKKKEIRLRSYDLTGPVVFEYPLVKGVREGYLAPGVAVSVEVDNARDISDYQTAYRELIVHGKKRNATLVGLIKEAIRRKKYVVVLVERVAHLLELSQRLQGIPHRLVFGQRSVQERIRAKGLFEKGKIRLILTNRVFKKGIDIKKVDVIIDAAAMKSKNDAVQKYGRGVRLCEGKTGLLYFDIADTENRFEKAAKRRRNALKKTGVPVFRVDADKGVKTVMDAAEKQLAKVIKQLEEDGRKPPKPKTVQRPKPVLVPKPKNSAGAAA